MNDKQRNGPVSDNPKQKIDIQISDVENGCNFVDSPTVMSRETNGKGDPSFRLSLQADYIQQSESKKKDATNSSRSNETSGLSCQNNQTSTANKRSRKGIGSKSQQKRERVQSKNMKKRRKSINRSKMQVSSSRPNSKNALVNDTDAATELNGSMVENDPIEVEMKADENPILDYDIGQDRRNLYKQKKDSIKDECGSNYSNSNSDKLLNNTETQKREEELKEDEIKEEVKSQEDDDSDQENGRTDGEEGESNSVIASTAVGGFDTSSIRQRQQAKRPSQYQYSNIMTWQNNSQGSQNKISNSNMMNISELLQQTEKLGVALPKNQANLYPQPLDLYKPKVTINHEKVNFGLNMYFKKVHKFGFNSEQGKGDLAPSQTFMSQPWGTMGCPVNKQENMTEYVVSNLKNVVFCRYGMDYLKTFPRGDDLSICSYKINLDYLIFQKQRQVTDTDNQNALIEMSFLKTKGQHQMNKAQAAAQNAAMAAYYSRNPNLQGNNSEQPNQPTFSRMIFPFYRQLDNTTMHNTLEFDSVFESGNLALAIKVADNEYNLLLQNDINTNGHTQWFYFRVKSNFKKKASVKFNILNLYKPKSLYQYGMRICALDVSKIAQKKEETKGAQESTASTEKGSDKEGKDNEKDDEKQELPKWERACKDIIYIQNKYTNEYNSTGLYQVEFKYDFTAGKNDVYFAHSIPYTYSMLNDYLSQQKCKRTTLCHSLAGNKVEYLHITNQSKIEKVEEPTPKNIKKKPIPIPKKQVLMLTSRVHPGETGASWMIHGLMDSLLNPKGDEEKELVKNLKDHFEIYIIPMMNVDGVINGNYRCSLAACDLNRKWTKPSKALHPPVYYVKKLCETIVEKEHKQFFLYLDFHGHSVKKNIFQYGNKTENWYHSRKNSNQMNFSPSLFPMILSRQFDYFNFQDCTFSMPKNKESTARITMFHQLKIPFVFTLEASFAGANQGNLKGKHFSSGDLMNVGKCVLKAIWEVKKLMLNKNLLKQIAAEAQSKVRQDDDGADSEEGSSSEDDQELPTAKEKIQKVVEKIEEDLSPEKRSQSLADKETVEFASPLPSNRHNKELKDQENLIKIHQQPHPQVEQKFGINMKQLEPMAKSMQYQEEMVSKPVSNENPREMHSQQYTYADEDFTRFNINNTVNAVQQYHQPQPMPQLERFTNISIKPPPSQKIGPIPSQNQTKVNIIGCPPQPYPAEPAPPAYSPPEPNLYPNPSDTVLSSISSPQVIHSKMPSMQKKDFKYTYNTIPESNMVVTEPKHDATHYMPQGAFPMTVKPSFYNQKKVKAGIMQQTLGDTNQLSDRGAKDHAASQSQKQNSYKKKKIKMDAIQLPESLSDSQAFASSKNTYLNQFIYEQLAPLHKKEQEQQRQQSYHTGVTSRLPTIYDQAHYENDDAIYPGMDPINKQQFKQYKKQFNIYQQQFVKTTPDFYFENGVQKAFNNQLLKNFASVDTRENHHQLQLNASELYQLNKHQQEYTFDRPMPSEDLETKFIHQQPTNKISRQKRYSSINDHKKFERDEMNAGGKEFHITLSAVQQKEQDEGSHHHPNTIRNLHFIKTSDTGFSNDSESKLRKHGTLKKMTKTHTENLQKQSQITFEENVQSQITNHVLKTKVLPQTELKIQPQVDYISHSQKRASKPLLSPKAKSSMQQELQFQTHQSQPQQQQLVNSTIPRNFERQSINSQYEGIVRRGSPLLQVDQFTPGSGYHPLSNNIKPSPLNQVTSFDTIAKGLYQSKSYMQHTNDNSRENNRVKAHNLQYYQQPQNNFSFGTRSNILDIGGPEGHKNSYVSHSSTNAHSNINIQQAMNYQNQLPNKRHLNNNMIKKNSNSIQIKQEEQATFHNMLIQDEINNLENRRRKQQHDKRDLTTGDSISEKRENTRNINSIRHAGNKIRTHVTSKQRFLDEVNPGEHSQPHQQQQSNQPQQQTSQNIDFPQINQQNKIRNIY